MSRRSSQTPRYVSGGGHYGADGRAGGTSANFGVAGSIPLPDTQASHLWTARETAVVRSRQGSVLTRGLILKADHFAGARRPHLDLHLQGAPNFRKADVPLEVYGCAQPSVTGLKGVLSVLKCRPMKPCRPSKLGQQREREFNNHTASGDHFSPRNVSSPMTEEGEVEGNKTPLLGTSPAQSYQGHGSPEEMPATLSSSPPLDTAPRRPPSRHLGATFDEMAPPRKCVWFCTREEPVVYISNRPFVLREAERPIENFEISDRAENLESIESRLKQDLLREAARYDGLLMVHEEDENGQLTPSWVAVDAESVSTVREVFSRVRKEGWAVDYHRVPIAANQSIENNYFDAYTRILKELDPTKTSVVANCGVGAVRTTVAMIAAVIVRRRQMIISGYDPLRLSQTMQDTARAAAVGQPTRRGSTPNEGVAKSLRAASEQQQNAQSLLRLMRLLNASVNAASEQPHGVLERLLSNPALLDALSSAYRGDYGIVRQLCGLLDDGLESKAVADLAIDSCSAVVHLREMVLSERVAYAVAKHEAPSGANDKDTSTAHLSRAVRTLEQYSSLVVFAEYVGGSATAAFAHRFSAYLKEREEVWRTLLRIRTKGSQLYLFAPIEDLSALSRGGTARGQIMGGSSAANGTLDRAHPGDEVAEHLIRHRAGVVLRPGMLLKQDVWRKFIEKNAGSAVRGAVNVRRVPGTSIFITGQPTKAGIMGLIKNIAEQIPENANAPLTVTWLNLREEPLVLVGGKPVVLRQKGSSLRNVREFMGISWERLTLLEDRLKADCIAELEAGEGKLLLHTETDEGKVVPRWEDTQASEIQTLQETMQDTVRELELRTSPATQDMDRSVILAYRRIPITAERPPDFADFDLLTRTVIRADVERNAIVLNDQLGRGRGTLTAVIVVLITRWLNRNKAAVAVVAETPEHSIQREPLSYHAVNALLRIVPHGKSVKATVDSAIDQCADVINLRDVIEDARLAAEETDDEGDRRARIQTGIQHLRRYYELCVFQAYLDATRPDTLEALPSFETFIKRQPVLDTLSHEFEKVDMSTITPLQKLEPDGMALNEEVQEVVATRNGSVLTAYTMLKSDMFPGLAKISLSQIEGIPNLRGVPLVLGAQGASTPISSSVADLKAWGQGMPSTQGIRRGLEYMGAGPNGSATVVASSMREEPVLFVNGRPHVLRLADQPLTNVEATGITTDVVESMEASLKNDVLKELGKYDGRLLLHDELELSGGRYEVVPQWFSVKPKDVQTPREVYETIKREGYRVDYARIPVTDEQAPVPTVFSELEERVLLALRTGSSTVSNCQMGRGRTTCAQVISLLVSTIAHRSEELLTAEMGASFISGVGSEFGGPDDDSDSVIDGAKDAMDNREDELWLAGEYRSMLQLVGVLAHGKLAKKLTDRAIDACDQVQNLRTAIYDARLRAKNAEPGTKKNAHLMRVYTNYLQRYGFLIVFTSYLLEKAQANLDGGSFDDVDEANSVASSALTAGRFPSFAAYLKPRREIQVILSQKPQ